MKKSINFIAIAGFAAVLVFSGCRKKETVEVDNETQSAVDNAVADQEFMAVVPVVNNHAINTKGAGANVGRGSAAPCDVLTQVSGDTLALGTSNYTAYPTYTLDVSNTCTLTMPDGKAGRQGTLWIRLTDKIKNPGAQMYIKMLNYKTGNITYSCDSFVVTTLTCTPLYTKFNVKLIKGSCQTASWTINYESDRTFTHYYKGNPSGTDPVTEVFGNSSGTNRQGRAFTVEIPEASPIVKHRSCQYIEKGVIKLTPKDFATRTIDFGNGACDEDATFTVNGNTVAFKLK